MESVALMAKKKAARRKRVEPEPEPTVRKNVISVRGTEAWREWLNAYAAFRRVPATSLIDQVLAESAKRDGFTPPPER
jgi:hypothetical protein